MRDLSLFIVTLGVILVNVCSCKAQNFGRNKEDEPLRMASDSLVVKSYKDDEEPAPAEDYRSYQGVMGRPGIDFPVLRNIPATDFNCRDVKRPGYYADLSTDCQVFHICDGGRKISFLCPNGTIFRQSHLICDWWFRVDCGKSVELYDESAEQLAADQKIYQARSIERERRKKIGKTSEEEGGGEVYALDEPFDGRTRTQTTRERNSKKVADSKSAEKFPSYFRPGKEENREAIHDSTPKSTFNRGNEGRIFNSQQTFKFNYQAPTAYTPEPSTFSTPTYKSRGFGDNHRIRENIQGAESGSLVGNLRNSARNENSLHFEAKLPESRIRGTTSTERPFINFKTSTEPRKQDYFRPSTARPDTGRKFYDGSANREAQPVRSQNFIRTTPKHFTTEKYTTPQPFKFFSTTEYRRPSFQFSSPRTTSTFAPFSPITSSTKANHWKVTEAPEDENLTTEIVPVETLYYATFGPEHKGAVTPTPRVDISLSQLNINKPTAETGADAKNYEDAVREGLEIPPSSGPNALRSFALYFAGNGGDPFKKGKQGPNQPKDLFYIPTVTEVEQKLNTFEEKKKDVVQRVDTIIKDNGGSTGEGSSAAEALPNSLTQQTRASYSALFDKNHTQTERYPSTESSFGTTAFEGFTEDAEKINVELKKNDLDSSQSRGLVEPDANVNRLNDEFTKVSPDLRELAQVFTKALSAYLDDPEAFRKVLSEIRPTEPSATEASTNPVDYPSVTQEDDEVLDFSDVTKTSYRRRTTTAAYRETTTEYSTEAPTTERDAENFIVAQSGSQNHSSIRVPSVELTAPLVESLDESQSSYYTPPPNVVATTNAIAEEINNEFAGNDKLPDIDSNEAVDSYLPIRGSVDDKSRPRYGGFQNNTNYSPYGSELTTTTPAPVTKDSDSDVPTTFNPRNISSSIFFRRKPEALVRKTIDEESTLAKELNNLAESDADKSSITEPSVPEFESIKLGNGETVERIRTRSTTARPVLSTQRYEQKESPKELSIELSPPYDTDPSDGYNEFDASTSRSAVEEFRTTTTYPTTVTDVEAETFYPTSYSVPEGNTVKYARSTTEEPFVDPTPKSFERIAELQQTLMFNNHNISHQEMEKARITVAEAVDNMTDTTADALMKMMEMAAKNETYRRLVLLLVNDKSGRNKTVEETRLALLRALLMPVISTSRARRVHEEQATTTPPPPTTTTPAEPTTVREAKRRGHFRRSKSISNGETRNVVRITTEPPKERAKNGRRTKARVISRVVKTTEVPTTTYSPNRLSNLELINRTIENSKTKDVKTNTLEDAILDSDSRAVELLRSLYSLAARWG